MTWPDGTAATGRAAELARNLAAVHARIAAAARSCGRDPAEITLIAVTKFFPASDAAILARLGVCELGESRDQEASAKALELATVLHCDVRWHFVGRLQSNKARSVARYADVVHSVDRPALVSALDAASAAAGRGPLDVLIQVSLDADTARGGAVAEQVPMLATQIGGTDGLRLAGVMAVVPMQTDPDRAFGRLAEIAAQVAAEHPGANVISAGMSGDLEAAVRHGATHLRIGTALLGQRSPVLG